MFTILLEMKDGTLRLKYASVTTSEDWSIYFIYSLTVNNADSDQCSSCVKKMYACSVALIKKYSTEVR